MGLKRAAELQKYLLCQAAHQEIRTQARTPSILHVLFCTLGTCSLSSATETLTGALGTFLPWVSSPGSCRDFMHAVTRLGK